MNKYTITAVLLAMSSASFANPSEVEAEEEILISSVRNFPVIIKNEVVAKDTCRLSFEGGTTKDVPCNTQNREIQAKG